MTDLSTFTYELVKPYEGTQFKLEFEDGIVVMLDITSVDLLREKHSHAKMKRDTFAIMMTGPETHFLPQLTYLMQHEQLGSPLAIFIVPLGKLEDGRFRYEAIFN